jgi:sugar O-acyltransferase (sialic acid O-acetyltransferase NeuD family)
VKKVYAIIGAGGHGKEIMPLARMRFKKEIERGEVDLLFVVENIHEDKVLNSQKIISLEKYLKIDAELYFNIAIGNSLARERLSKLLTSQGCRPFSVVAADVTMLDGVKLGEGYTISPQTIITSNVTIGDYFQANCQCVISHDCQIGNFVTLAPGVRCNGNVIIEDHAYIGAGSVIINGTSDKPLIIGRNSVVGMGAIVIRNVSANTTVVGNPAKVIKVHSKLI